jgi:hypothetical protein
MSEDRKAIKLAKQSEREAEKALKLEAKRRAKLQKTLMRGHKLIVKAIDKAAKVQNDLASELDKALVIFERVYDTLKTSAAAKAPAKKSRKQK